MAEVNFIAENLFLDRTAGNDAGNNGDPQGGTSARQYLLMRGGLVAVEDQQRGKNLRLWLSTWSGAPTWGMYLGKTRQDSVSVSAGTELYAIDLESIEVEKLGQKEVREAEAGEKWQDSRQALARLDAMDAYYLSTALALLKWHRSHGRCPRCGAITEVLQHGWMRRCPQDGSEHFPRTDPAIIVSVVDAQGRILLGRGVNWPHRKFSTLAGYVDPGESMEQAVHREIWEEAGLELRSVEYLGSQSWPFPASLMIGFTAYAQGDQAVPDGREIADLRWFTREELAEAHNRQEISLPSSVSIARRLIERWYGGSLGDGEQPSLKKAGSLVQSQGVEENHG